MKQNTVHSAVMRFKALAALDTVRFGYGNQNQRITPIHITEPMNKAQFESLHVLFVIPRNRSELLHPDFVQRLVA